MDLLNFKTNEELLLFLHQKKTEISCIEQPHILLTQLRDHDLLPENLFENVKKVRSREQKEKLYEVLDWFEKNRPQYVQQFWSCVFEDHILQRYPMLRILRNSLLGGTFSEKPPDVETPTKEKDKGKAEKRKKNDNKRIKDDGSSEDSEDLFSTFTPKQRKPDKTFPFSSPVKKGDEQEIWTWPFDETQLPVTCGDKEGTLDRDKLAKGEKCILSESCWFTPNHFEKFAGKEKNKNWKFSIRCREIPLKKLIDEGHLKCPERKSIKKTCVQKMDQNNDDECYVCRSEKDLVCCDECPQAFHSDCHLPAVHGDSSGEWICTFCVLRNSQQWRDPTQNMSEQEAFDAPVSQYRLHCHCLLLCVYREDIQKVFVKDPRPTVPRYSEFITQPMWLDRIKQKLESGRYQTVQAFVSDFQLIFSNCSTFYRDNEFGRMGARLKQKFEEEFRKIFKIAEEFTPEVLLVVGKDKHETVYSFLCPHVGQFRCSLTNLVFVMEGEGEVCYNTDSWDPRLLDGLGEMQPAGPLYDINCLNGTISGLHLPHCEIFSEDDMDCLAVAHFSGGNVAIMNPLKVTEAHVMIDIKDLSIFGLIKKKISPPSPVVAQVLVFLRPVTVREDENILDVHLLPRNVPVSETEKFELNFGPDYHPTFEVLVNVRHKEVTLSLLDNTDGCEMWVPQRILLTESEFVNKCRRHLIEREFHRDGDC